MIVSAGIGDIVKYSFEHLFEEIEEKILLKIVSNFGEYDANRMLTGFSEPIIHSLNKEDILSDVYTHKFSTYHTSAIVLGDMIQDA